MRGRSDLATPVRRALPRAALLLVAALTAGCGSLANEVVPTVALNPDYRGMIAKHLKIALNKAPPDGPAEISDPRWVLSNKGWAWQVCIHFQDRGHQRTYVVFFDRTIVDERYAVQTDACGTQTYSEFDLGSGMRPAGVGPLY
jgi:hypothetical protein